jgi:hypothetical protein
VDLRTRLLLAGAGALGALAWALQQPLDKRALRCGYDDVELLGRWLPVERGWYGPGLALHVANGAAFGLAYSELARRTPSVRPAASAMAMALVEHATLFPLGALVDRHHPAREQLAPIFGARQFAQATWRHAILGAVLGVVAERVLHPTSAAR